MYPTTLCRELKLCNNSSAVTEMGDRCHDRLGPKRGGAAVPLSRELGPRLIQCGMGRGLFPYQVASSYIQPFGRNRHGPKIGWRWVCPFFWWLLCPHRTQSRLGRGLAPPFVYTSTAHNSLRRIQLRQTILLLCLAKCVELSA